MPLDLPLTKGGVTPFRKWGAKGIRGLLGGAQSQDGLGDFGEAFASLLGRNIGGEVLHAVGEVQDVFHSDGMREILKHRFVVGGITAEDETILVIVQL